MRETPPLIDTTKALEGLLEKLRSEDVIGFDAEMDSFFSYHTKLCLIQISTSQGDYLVDPLADLDLSPLNEITENPEQVKVFHAGENDIPFFRKFCGWQFQEVFDTHLAARILNLPQAGLAGLLEEFLDVQLDKKFQRADWRVRPLPQDQADYARLDTRYLLELREILSEQLHDQDKGEEAHSTFAKIVHAEMREKEFDPDAWGRVKGAVELAPSRRGVLKELYLWRDQKARERDEAPFRVVPDPFLLNLARKAITSEEALVKWARHGNAKRFKSELVKAVKKGLKHENLALPRKKKKVDKNPLDPKQQKAFSRLRTWRNEHCEQTGLDPDRVATNRLLKAVARSLPENPKQLAEVEGMEGWRLDSFGEAILEQVKE